MGMLVGVLVSSSGCRTPRNVLALREENRQLEERLYQVAALLADCRRENRRLREELKAWVESPEPGLSFQKPEDRVPGAERGEQLLREPGLPKIHVEGVPQPDPTSGGLWPSESGGSGGPYLPELSGHQKATHTVVRPTGAYSGRNRMPDPKALLANSRKVDRIELNAQLTGGWDADAVAGDEGIRVMIEPRGPDGQLLPAAGSISVVVIDPALAGAEARLARWDISPEDCAERFYSGPEGEGILLHLTWPTRVPVHSRLHLFVRFTTEDGRKIERDTPLTVKLLPVVAGAESGSLFAPLQNGDGTSWVELPSGSFPRDKPRTARQNPVWSPLR